jgi:hypothetical protein
LVYDPAARFILAELDSEEHQKAIDIVTTSARELAAKEKPNEKEKPSEASAAEIAAKTKKRVFGFTVKKTDDPVKAEIEAYLQVFPLAEWGSEFELTSESPIRLCKNSNPLNFWKQRCSEFPILSRSARYYLCGSSSSASVERMFSYLNLNRTDLRSGLSADRLESLTVLRANEELHQKLRLESKIRTLVDVPTESWAHYEKEGEEEAST